MSRITAVIFDMYETLVQNPLHLWRTSFEEIISKQGLDTNIDRLWEEWFTVELEFRNSRVKPDAPFRTYYEAWRDAFARAFTSLSLRGDSEAAARKFIQDISRREPFPETVAAVSAIQRGWRTAVLSNADDDYLLPNLKLLGLKFDAVLSSEMARVYKPLPGLFRQMLCRLGVSPQESVYVGDRQLEDVQGAARVGMSTVWVNRSRSPLNPELPQPTYQISSLLQLPGLLPSQADEKWGVQGGEAPLPGV
ncbi:MAG: HAD family hydrolase [Chloroflexota bacterium]